MVEWVANNADIYATEIGWCVRAPSVGWVTVDG